jgi:hypothetical protein
MRAVCYYHFTHFSCDAPFYFVFFTPFHLSVSTLEILASAACHPVVPVITSSYVGWFKQR